MDQTPGSVGLPGLLQRALSIYSLRIACKNVGRTMLVINASPHSPTRVHIACLPVRLY